MKKALLVVLAAMLLISAAVIADPVIKISGVIALRNEEGVWQLTLDEFKELPQTEFFVTDPWMGDKTYVGVTLADLLKFVGVPSGTKNVVLVCSDEKEFAVSYEDALKYPVMLTHSTRSGENLRALPASQGGPIKLAYPINDFPEITDKYPSDNWAWYVIEVRVEM
ncbi:MULTISPECIES: molybdopterin-dependent oxidoreductase [unclassified Mesotoga]|jgi:hypothetical protein|uniref:molybdopterin-dependent oxidoreductase n=1 Tax=unclassified Mesotoga TaxID=1184398 RepID=UPI000EF222EE|nr:MULTISPECIES: molybdopterin-dependent oxidoreductase [unclassified Mesotoga]MDI9367347.1 molybdopterin-dependent oxidoreductase [Thermotogota bacterium]NLT44129.1 molybdopterin-dependent oxidoreductase [Thermotogaceae bacterium]MDD4207603.1 molybdopterin-dependent oxidoreductase [Mesotoga sp.]MDD4825968.1 molybdopterin-dependent oxidoreductase [Mesotoga sp.]MDD5683254.1 molybdopterin-dependent oxidoreductase [Mesotoga sp.]